MQKKKNRYRDGHESEPRRRVAAHQLDGQVAYLLGRASICERESVLEGLHRRPGLHFPFSLVFISLCVLFSSFATCQFTWRSFWITHSTTWRRRCSNAAGRQMAKWFPVGHLTTWCTFGMCPPARSSTIFRATLVLSMRLGLLSFSATFFLWISIRMFSSL